MLYINLLPQQKKKKVSHGEKELAIYVLLIIFVLFGIYGIHKQLDSKLQSLQRIKDSRVELKNKLKEKASRIQKMEKELQELNEKIEIIKKIRSHQSLPVLYLNELIEFLPEDKIWFDALNLNPQGEMNLSGVALDNQAFASYVHKLRKSDYIRDINLERTSRQDFHGLGLVAFQCQIKTKAGTLSEQK